MNKAYKRINWENYPSDATPLNEANLNNLDSATDTIDWIPQKPRKQR